MKNLLVLVAVALLAAGCAKEKTAYGDARGVETVTNQFGSTDLQLIAESMARSMQQAPVIAQRQPADRHGAGSEEQDERVHRHALDHRFDPRRAAEGRPGALRRRRARHDAAGRRDQAPAVGVLPKEAAVEKGQMVGAQYRMEGNITSIVKEVKNTKDVYYKFNLQLWNIRNGLLEWSDEKEIRKTTTR